MWECLYEPITPWRADKHSGDGICRGGGGSHGAGQKPLTPGGGGFTTARGPDKASQGHICIPLLRWNKLQQTGFGPKRFATHRNIAMIAVLEIWLQPGESEAVQTVGAFRYFSLWDMSASVPVWVRVLHTHTLDVCLGDWRRVIVCYIARPLVAQACIMSVILWNTQL